MPSNHSGLADLPWLPRLSPDFRARLQSIEQDSFPDWGRQLRAVATQFLGLNQAIAITKTLDRLRSRGTSQSLSPFRLGLVSNATTDFLQPFLVASALRYGIALELVTADFGQFVLEAINPQSSINVSRPDGVLLAVDHRGLPFRTTTGVDWPLFDARAAIGELATVRDGFRQHGGAPCFVQTLPAPAELLFGSLDASTAGTLRAEIAHFNADVARGARERGDVLVDIDWLAQCIGLDEWYDERHWYLARLPWPQTVLPLYADFVTRTIAAVRGKSRKCLVLDLDNTLWGGVIGDDGLEGIALSPGDARGESFRAIQSLAADLRRRGIVLAVCTKNEESTAKLPFRSHSSMILKERDIAVFVANWDDKATNIERIARQLELGLDSIVLLDDNPAERAQVRQALPEVAVPELGDDPSSYPRVLSAAGYFEAVAFTREDLARAEQYRENADRVRALDGSRNLDDFLRSLQMQIEFAPFNATGRSRISQLINKTNQFNVTTRRYTEQQVAAFEDSADHYTLQVSARDRFGDNGMISVVICTKGAAEWEIDSWLMSCRVLNCGIEQAVCNQLAEDARRAGATCVVGRFIPTPRNGVVHDLYKRLGFTRAAASPDAELWILELDQFTPFEVFLALRA
jgi:FkbH-like protein